MKITQDVRDYAKEHGIGDLEQVVVQGMEEKSLEFRKAGSEIYSKE